MNNILRITSIMLLLTLSAYGQGVKTTTPVGLAVADVPAGNTALSIPFLKADLYQGAVVSLAENPEEISTTIILTEADWSAGRFDEGDFPKFYAEIQETSQYSGLGLDIIESGPNWIKVYGLFSDFGISAGDKLVIRTHYVIDDLFAFLGNDRKIEQRGSVIKLFYPDGQSGAAVWTGTDWASTDGTSTTGETPIYPGQGFILSSDLPLKLVHTGNVRTTPLLIPAYAEPCRPQTPARGTNYKVELLLSPKTGFREEAKILHYFDHFDHSVIEINSVTVNSGTFKRRFKDI